MSNGQSVYAVGSEWRRWDLHVHTPASLVNVHYGGGGVDEWEAFLKDLETLPEDLKVIGICDYWSIEGYQKVMEYRKAGGLKKLERILPTVELRLRMFAGARDLNKINMHVIFSDEIPPEIIQEQFLNQLECGCMPQPELDGKTLSGYVTKNYMEKLGEEIIACTPVGKRDQESAVKVGFANACVDDASVYHLLEKSPYFNNGQKPRQYLTAIGRNEWNNMNWNGQGVLAKKTIANKADLMLCASDTTDVVREDRQKLEEDGVNSRLLHCSDAHYGTTSSQLNRLGHSFTWIKADPTFDGLRQVVFDYDDRVCICDHNPLQEHPRQYFSKIALPATTALRDKETGQEVGFENADIPLNPYLVTVIGGRGSGKSLLLRALGSCCIGSETELVAEQRLLDECTLSLTLHKSSTDEQVMTSGEPGHVDYLYVGQGDVKAAVESPMALSSSLNQLLGIQNSSIGAIADSNVMPVLESVSLLKQMSWVMDDAGHEVDARGYHVKLRSDAEGRLQSQETSDTKELVAELSAKRDQVQKTDLAMSRLQSLSKRTVELEQEVNDEILQISSISAPGSAIPNVDLKEVRAFLTEWEASCEKESETLHARIIEVESKFANLGITADPQEALKRIEQHQTTIRECDTALEKLGTAETEMQRLWTSLSEFSISLSQEIASKTAEIAGAWQGVKEGKSGWDTEQKETVTRLLTGIEVQGTVDFSASAFYSLILECLNKGKFRRLGGQTQEDRVRASLQVNGLDDYIALIANSPRIVPSEGDQAIPLSEFVTHREYFNTGGIDEFLKTLLTSEYRDKYLKVIPTVRYGGKSLGALSVGQRGTVYVVIKLATSTFGIPLVYDQPEDDLDNKFISLDLVPLIRSIKRYRQIIMVTHNANLVVNTDAEQVIVANNAAVGGSEHVSYMTGSIENTNSTTETISGVVQLGIREQACAILEGGEKAFKQRERRYGLNTAT